MSKLERDCKYAPTPPMGWNSYDVFGCTVTETEVRANAEYMAQHLRSYGWKYVVVDMGWYVPSYGEDFATPTPPFAMDEYGRLQPAPNLFPSAAGGAGFKPLADYVHSLGLKFGIHIMRGISRQALKENTPILGTTLRAADIVDTSSTCEWCDYTYGVDPTKPGAREWYDSNFALYADWGVDFIKVDDISHPYSRGEIEIVRGAIDGCGREILLSLSPGPAPLEEAEHLKRNANMWRISADFWDRWDDLRHAFDLCAQWQGHGAPGHWPDADMLPLGRIGIRQHPLNSPDRQTRFTRDEQVTMMTLWSIFRSPLMLGGNLPDTDPWTLSLITNPEVLSVLNESRGSRELYRRGDQIAWAAEGDSCTYLALFNVGENPAVLDANLAELGIAGPCAVRDLWARQDMEAVTLRVSAEVPPHGARLLRLIS